MSETALKFGPEWLRALSHGSNLSSPPSSPGPVRFKLADYRYGREEMLALFSKDFPPPDGLQNLGSLCIEHMQEPLAFLPMNLEEQRIWQRCVNSEAVLRGSGRASINGVGRGRGGSVDRGRGRGRGVGAPYYSRGLSYDEEPETRGVREGGPPGISLSRNKSYERSQSTGDSRGWVSERTLMERAPGIGEERSGATSPQKGRATTDNWRARTYEEELSGDRWRGLVHARNDKWGTRGGWRERDDESEWDDGRTPLPPHPHMRNSRPPWEAERDKEGQRRHWEEDNLPEWATEAADDKGGSFDATGAFHAPGFSDEDDGDMQEFPPTKDADETGRAMRREKGRPLQEEGEGENKKVEKQWVSDHKNSQESHIKAKTAIRPDDKGPPVPVGNQHHGDGGKKPDSGDSTSPHLPLVNGILSEEEKNALCSSATPSPPIAPTLKQVLPPTVTSFVSSTPTSVPHSSIQPRLDEGGREEDKLEHMQSVADDLVAKLVEDDDPRPLSNARPKSRPPPPGGFIPADPIPPEDHWYYTDPQGDIQGPFSSADMDAWYKAGYFKINLLLRRQCDDKFAQLGDLTSLFGRIPFQPGPTVPPLKVSDLLTAQKVQAERERYELMQAQVMQKQIYQQQNSLRQQQVLQTLQSLEDWNRLSVAQQQQLFIQQMMALPPLVPPTLPVSLHTATPTTVHSAQSQPPPPELRGALSTSRGPPHLPLQPDPIQAFVAQMATSSSSPGVAPASSEPSGTQPPPASSPMGTESPLQKLLIQLQRSSQSASLAPSATSPSVAATASSSLSSVPPPASMALDKGSSDQQYDAIQSLMSQLTKMQIAPTDPVQDDHRQRELEQKRIEDERRQFEEQKRVEEERIKIQEIRLQEERLKEEERRKELEAKNQRLEEELRRIQEEQVKRRKEQENKLKETEKKLENQQKVVDAVKKDEEQKRQQQHLKKQRQEEEARKREGAKKVAEEEERRKEEHRIKIEQKRKEEEERKKKEEKERQLQIHVQEEMQRIALEEERRRMQQLEEESRKKQQQEEEEQARRQQQRVQQQKAPALEKTKSVPPAWNTVQISQENNAPSLAEIQKTQEIKERKEREAEAVRENQRQKEAQRQAVEERRQREGNMKWATRVSQNSKGETRGMAGPKSLQPPIKSLLEIQKEEEKEFKKRQEKEQAERAATISHLSLSAAGVWGSASQSLSWANRTSSGAIPSLPISTPQVTQQQAWGAPPSTVAWSAIAQSKLSPGLTNESSIAWNQGSNLNNSVGFWENPDTVKGPSKPTGTTRSPPKGHAPQSQSSAKSAGIQAVNSNKTNKKKSKDESENVKKLFADSLSPADTFTQWCKVSLHSMKVHASIDIPTFVGFLADVESPYEVHDYIRSYLGDSKEVKEFAKQYLERRSTARNAQKEKYEDDNILAPAPAVNPGSGLELTEIKSNVYSVHQPTRLKRGRKKMQKVNSSILGFNVNALERVDVEDGN